jgi:hypothetical protein
MFMKFRHGKSGMMYRNMKNTNWGLLSIILFPFQILIVVFQTVVQGLLKRK